MPYHPFKNLGLKCLAVGLATALWLTVLGEHTVERSLRVPLEFRNVPDLLEIVGDTPDMVDVRLRGASGLLSRLQPGDVLAVLDLEGVRPGSRLFHLGHEQVQAPFGVEVTQVVPPTVALEIERSGTREVPVVPTIDGSPAAGFVLGRVETTPPTVTVVGPVSRLDKLDRATTEPVSVEGATDQVRDTVTVGVMDAALRLAEPSSATVLIEVRPAPVTRQVDGVPVQIRHLDPGRRADLTPETVSVSVRGSQELLAGLSSRALTAFVDLAGLGPGQYNRAVYIDPPPEFGISGVEPATVSVRIR